MSEAKLNDQAGSVTDTQRLDWLLRECEIIQLDENGARFGEDLMDRDDIDAVIHSKNA